MKLVCVPGGTVTDCWHTDRCVINFSTLRRETQYFACRTRLNSSRWLPLLNGSDFSGPPHSSQVHFPTNVVSLTTTEREDVFMYRLWARLNPRILTHSPKTCLSFMRRPVSLCPFSDHIIQPILKKFCGIGSS
jgi:hypothetical protein